jgi:hypothetical protein
VKERGCKLNFGLRKWKKFRGRGGQHNYCRCRHRHHLRKQQCNQISNELRNSKKITLQTVAVLFLFAFFNLILDAPRRETKGQKEWEKKAENWEESKFQTKRKGRSPTGKELNRSDMRM